MKKKMYYANSAIGIIGGYSAYKYLPRYIKAPYTRYFQNKCNKIQATEHNQYWDSAIYVYLKSQSFNPNVQIVDINKTNWKVIANDIIQKRELAYSN